MNKRLQMELDDICLEIIEHSRLYVLASADNKRAIKLCSIDTLSLLNMKQLFLSADIASKDIVSNEKQAESSVSLYFLMPGIGHGLRVNGEMHLEKEGARIDIRCAYLHCARAAARAKLWADLESTEHRYQNVNVETMLQYSAYLFLKTRNSRGQVELSPRGDLPGFVKNVAPNNLFIPERPGNKVAVSLRNILQDERVELLMFLPGSCSLMRVVGKARLSTDPEYLEMTRVGNKPPKVGILLRDCQFSMINSEALNALQKDMQNGLFTVPTVKSFSKAFSEHTSGKGLKGKLAHIVIDGVVKKDMRSLY
ncbi:pyridoxamine 5'-phosphate oxidase family protein [Pseudoteredinibacter isoporae]|uniref:Pyridoxamine 5'-phosphate oxidase N-terminal domain-containing protein n=1 Tax=Pseudoteredinibacter isoporae TaxID=570281 RepID=A0A7X0JTY2_9GAMM|nr:pyridoxamine 5'-phosphate oxidase family protein [Pseudoteredinibacter isoporae]MBB6521380.1 hypothetical protein [Pseudoteredinibacter isoporae]NHO86935.1 hypothetical protein [Pseudoteredinibacter isoporae]NIB24612.1 hypothetical protein [Pseudoteredinibacter isoporae]